MLQAPLNDKKQQTQSITASLKYATKRQCTMKPGFHCLNNSISTTNDDVKTATKINKIL